MIRLRMADCGSGRVRLADCGLRVCVLLALTASPAGAQLSVSGYAGFVDRRLSDAGAVEHQRGLIGGGRLGVTVAVVSVTLAGEGGRLTAESARTPDVDYAAVTAELVLAPAAAVALRGGLGAHVYVSPLGTQRWVLPQFGAELRVPFRNLPAQARLGATVITGATTSGVAAPSAGVALRAGLVAGGAHVKLLLDYRFERLNFDAVGAGREEQRSVVRVGMQLQ